MKSFFSLFSLIALGSIPLSTFAQVVFQEPKLRPLALPLLDETAKVNYATFSLPPFIDNDQLLREEQEERRILEESSGRRSGFYQFGKAFTVQLNIADGAWHHVNENIRLWRLSVESRNAKSLHLLFDDFELPPGAELYIVSVSEDGKENEVVGPFTQSNNKEHRQFSFLPVQGNKLVIELYADSEELPSISISHVVHGYKEMFTPEKGRSGSCNINVACNDGDEWRDQIRGVAMMMSNYGQGYCSGSMINSLKNDGRQLFLTAYHCTGRDVSRDILLFNYESESCSSGSARSGRHSAQGLKKLAAYHSSDFTLFEVEEAIPESYNVYLNGWSSELEGYVPVTPVGIHHPSADIKKISFSEKQVEETCWYGSCGRRPEDHWKIPQWTKGTTEPGSSGSPLFDGKTKRIVGQLHGGSASCSNVNGYDVYGKLQISYDFGDEGSKLKNFLDPEATGQRFNDGSDLNTLRKQVQMQ